MATLANLNLVLAFALELAMLAALAVFGFRITGDSPLRWLLALALPLAAAGIWGLLLAPKSSRRLSMLPGIALSLVLFLLAAIALWHVDRPALAALMAAAAVLHAVLALVWRQW